MKFVGAVAAREEGEEAGEDGADDGLTGEKGVVVLLTVEEETKERGVW